MSFWSSEKLIRENNYRKQHSQKELIYPFEDEFVQHGAYELSLGSEAFITSKGKGTKQKIDSRKQQIVIPPGQFGLLLTKETVAIPNNAIAFISMKFSIKQRGLVNVSGFHVDPGFAGRLKFAVYNAGSKNIVLSYGQRVFMIWLCELTDASLDVYDGEHANQDEITSEDVMRLQGEVASPAELNRQIKDLRRDVTILWSILVGIFIALAILLITKTIDNKQAPAGATSTIIPSAQTERTPLKESSEHSNRNTSPLDSNNRDSANTPSGK